MRNAGRGGGRQVEKEAGRQVLYVQGLVLSYVLANTPMESNGQGWGAWCSLVEMC